VCVSLSNKNMIVPSCHYLSVTSEVDFNKNHNAPFVMTYFLVLTGSECKPLLTTLKVSKNDSAPSKTCKTISNV